MRRIDARYLIAQFAGARMLRDLLRSEGHRIGRMRVRTMMARIRIGAPYRKSRTIQRHPAHRVYPYLLRHLAITRSNPVWAPDITCRPITRGFVYLFAAMDRVEMVGEPYRARASCPASMQKLVISVLDSPPHQHPATRLD